MYSEERNVQIVISLLKSHGIRKVIASPGTTNMSLVGSLQNDPFFEMYSCVDERSAAYMACGMAEESGEPVVLSCTGATASRNYMPGLTEAFYRKLPVLAITSHRGDHAIGHLFDQQLDRRISPSDIFVDKVTVPNVKDQVDEIECVRNVNRAILSLTLNGGGPVHINLFTQYKQKFDITKLPDVRTIHRHTIYDDFLPELPKGRIAIFVGVHRTFSHREVQAIERFCACHDAVVLTNSLSGYHGRHAFNYTLVTCQRNYRSPLLNIDLFIHIGEISGGSYEFSGKSTWRVNEDGMLRDTFGNLTDIFQMPEYVFFEKYTDDTFEEKNEFALLCQKEYDTVFERILELPFSNIWMASQLAPHLPEGCELYLGILNCLRSWNFFNLPSTVFAKCNVGGYGIDGGLSTLLGASLASPSKLFFGVFGDLGFFYDMNVLGNRHFGKNVRIMVVNNGRGTEFRNYGHPCSIFDDDADAYLAAAGHYGSQSKDLVRHYAEDLGFKYLSASSKEDFLINKDVFLDKGEKAQSVLFEVFTDYKDESDALELMLNLFDAPDKTLAKRIKEKVYQMIGKEKVDAIRTLLK